MGFEAMSFQPPHDEEKMPPSGVRQKKDFSEVDIDEGVADPESRKIQLQALGRLQAMQPDFEVPREKLSGQEEVKRSLKAKQARSDLHRLETAEALDRIDKNRSS